MDSEVPGPTMKFHRRCGDRVTLLNNNCTAIRNFVEFNHGLILSAYPLIDDILFEVCIDRKVHVWNGSLEIGATTLDPECNAIELPATATKLRNTAWIMSGRSIVLDGVTIIENYGPELDSLHEGDCVGVMRSSRAELMFFINGRCLGIAAFDIPSGVYAVIDLYGQCVQVSIMNNGMRPVAEGGGEQAAACLVNMPEDPNNDDTLASGELMDVAGLPPESYPKEPTVYVPLTTEGACALVAQDRLRFHPRCGILVKLSANNKTAERARPLDDYNNGVVMTHRPLYDGELFEIRIDRLVDKWSGSIEVGLTTHNPATIRFPSTMTNMDSGTIMMSGCKVLLNGHGTCMEYGNFNLDELREGDTVGLMHKDGKLHYFINGIDQGVATDNVHQQVWGVIDLYGMTVTVTIVDPCEDSEMAMAGPASQPTPETSVGRLRPEFDEETLLFHTLRDSNVIIINDGKTAHRPNAFEYFNNGIVMTNRPLKTNELLQVRLDLVIPKWAGSIEIGVTQNTCNEIQFPFKMSNVKSGIWALAGENVLRDGVVIIPQYVRNLNRLVEGDTVGVVRKNMGILHFYVNGADQGPAAFNVPEVVFGIVDLYGRVAQATIVEEYTPPLIFSPDSTDSSESNATIYPEMCFHRVHGCNARLSRNRLTALRATIYSEFKDAVLFSSRPLRECEMFEIRIDKMVDCWIGSIEIGVTGIRPDDLESNGGMGALAGTATDLSWDTYILSGAAIMKDGECVRSGYGLDLDCLTVGSRVGMMYHANRSLHYYLDGIDMGRAWYVPHLNIYAVVDLYGQCTQVTILQNEERTFNYNGCNNSENSMLPNRVVSTPSPPYCSFSEYCGENVVLMKDYSIARRRMIGDPMGAITFSSAHLAFEEMFEIKIMQCKHGFAGGFRIGVTDINILNAHVNRSFPPSIVYLPHFTAFIEGKYIKYTKNGGGVKDHELRSFMPSLDWLRPGDRIGLKKTYDSKVLVYYNSELLDCHFERVPDKVYVVMELYGDVAKIQVISRKTIIQVSSPPPVSNKDEIKQQCIRNVANNAYNVISNSMLSRINGNGEVIPSEDLVDNNSENKESKTTSEADLEPNNDPDDTEFNDDIPERSDDSLEPVLPGGVTVNANIDRRRRPLPYTFHYITGKNIKLCSSDTVAMRINGYNYGIAVVSQPLRRGHNFRFRVDKVSSAWVGGVAIGAVGALPTEPLLPMCALHLDPPGVWIASSDIWNDNGNWKINEIASVLDDLQEQSVLTVHFKLNSDLVLEQDGKILGPIASIPRGYSHVFPLIDLYGRVQQVSVLLHPYVVTRGTSLDLPIIDENLKEESIAELNSVEDRNPRPILAEVPSTKREYKTQSQDSSFEPHDPLLCQAGPSSKPDAPTHKSVIMDNDLKNNEIKCRKRCPDRRAMHHSIVLPDNESDDDVYIPTSNRCMHKSHSTQNFATTEKPLLESEFSSAIKVTLSLGSGIANEEDEITFFCDTNIRHNDRYPEANDVDNLDNEIMDALTLETGNLPDLTEEQSSSIDESTRRDDIWSEQLSLENLNYLSRILCLDQEFTDGQSLESEWETSGESCEHLHLVLKYWNFLVLPYPELRHAVSWGQVRCYCQNCQPDGQLPFAGWVRIERIDGVGAATRAFWHVVRSTLASAQVTSAGQTPPRRPRSLMNAPCVSPPLADIWFDEEGKPHHTVLAIEIDVEGSEADNDRLLAFLIYLKPHVMFNEDNPPSLDE